jgi:hypothetical protein
VPFRYEPYLDAGHGAAPRWLLIVGWFLVYAISLGSFASRLARSRGTPDILVRSRPQQVGRAAARAA